MSGDSDQTQWWHHHPALAIITAAVAALIVIGLVFVYHVGPELSSDNPTHGPEGEIAYFGMLTTIVVVAAAAGLNWLRRR